MAKNKSGTISILMSLKDQFSGKMEKVTETTQKSEKQLKSMKNTMEGWRKKTVSSFDGIIKSAGKAALAITGISSALSVAAVQQFSSKAMELAEAQLDVETKLETLLGNNKSIAAGGTQAVKNAAQELKDYASEIQGKGVVGDEVLLAGMQQLSSYQVGVDTIKKLSSGMADLLVQMHGLNSTQSDAVSIGNMLGKTMAGSTSALTRAGIVMSDTEKELIKNGDEAQRAATLAQVLAENVNGVNAATANLPQGKIQQFENAWGDVQEQVGMKLLELKSQFTEIGMDVLPYIQDMLLDLVESAKPAIEHLSEWIKDNKAQVITTIQGIGETVKTVASKIGSAISFVNKHSEAILNVIGAVGGALAALSVADKVMKVITLLKTVQASLAVITTVGLGPIGLAIVGIGAAVGLIIANWDKIGPKVKKVGDWMQEHIVPIFEFIAGVIEKSADVVGALLGTGGNNDSSSVGHNALGTQYWGGGLTTVGEHGAELVNLPRGSKVYSADRTANMAGGNTVNVSLNISGNVIGNRELYESMGEYLANQVTLALARGGTA